MAALWHCSGQALSRTGWQPPFPPSLFHPWIWIICKRYGALPLNCSLEKCLATAESWHWLIAFPQLAWWLKGIHMGKLKMSYHTVYPSWYCPVVVCPLFLYSFISAPTTAFTWLSKFCTLQLSSIFYLSTDLSRCRVSFQKGTYVVHPKSNWKK